MKIAWPTKYSRDVPDALIIAGGGSKAISALGAVHVLQREGRLKHLKMVAGTSAGAIVAAGVALGRPPVDMCTAFVREVYSPDLDVRNFAKNFGLDSGVHLTKWIDIVLGGETYTFESIKHVKGIELVVCATNLTQRKPVYFTAQHTPEVDVATAIRMSCAIPLYFRAVTLDDDVYVDGALFDNFPYEWIANRQGINFPFGIAYASDRHNGPVTTLDAYFSALIQCATNQQTVRENANVMYLKCGDAKVFDFKSPKILKKLFVSGVTQTRELIKKKN